MMESEMKRHNTAAAASKPVTSTTKPNNVLPVEGTSVAPRQRPKPLSNVGLLGTSPTPILSKRNTNPFPAVPVAVPPPSSQSPETIPPPPPPPATSSSPLSAAFHSTPFPNPTSSVPLSSSTQTLTSTKSQDIDQFFSSGKFFFRSTFFEESAAQSSFWFTAQFG